MPKTVRTMLRENGATGIFRGVALETEGGGKIGLNENGSSKEILF